jgi:phenylalanyl-tRNA synthetase beta chain
MRAPLSWLRDYAPLDADVDRLVEALSELGLVVDGIERVGEGLEDVVVARVLDIRAHPNADRVRLVDVDPGDGGPLQVVCGAWNFRVGDLVALAPAGAVLPGDFKISRQKMRGEWSNGMLCSAPELALPEAPGAENGLLILDPDCGPPGAPLSEALGISPDVVFDLDITPNRPDALSMAGIARDLAAVLNETWRRPPPPAVVPVDDSLGSAPVTVTAGALCPRFTATVLEGVPEGPSPQWLARRLTLAGMRPISAVVDVSNYVMLDLGQPNHAYDLERLGGHGILVRGAAPGETIETLDGVERVLDAGDCVICDAEGTPVGVGGIMGGAGSEIGPGTRRVLLEAAWFSPMAIARTGKRLGLASEARTRFERGVDPMVAGEAVERFLGLLASVPGGENLRRGPMVDVQDPGHMPVPPTIRLRAARANALLGTDLPDSVIARLLGSIGFDCRPEPTAPGCFDVTVPSWRLEVQREIDLVEEVARLWGYRRIARTFPVGVWQGSAAGLDRTQKERRRIREVLAGAGFSEAWTTTFLAPDDLDKAGLDPRLAVEVENPLDRAESILRTSLLPGLLKAVRFNIDRQAAAVSLFETGRVFRRPTGEVPLPDEEEILGVIVRADPEADRDAAVRAITRTWAWLAESLGLAHTGLEAATGPGLHPGRAARIIGAGGRELGAVGEVAAGVAEAYGIESRLGYLTVSLDWLREEPRRPRIAQDVSRYPAADVDLAFVVAEVVPAAAVHDSLVAAGGEVLESVTLFDVFRGEQIGNAQRSLAFRLRFRALDHTLSDSELAELRQAAIDRVADDHRGELRG